MPNSDAYSGLRFVCFMLFTNILPFSGWYIPDSTFIKDDLPAPFSPSKP